MDKEHLDIPPLELHYLDWIQKVFDFKKINGAVATIERIDEREVVFGLRHRSGGSTYTIPRDILRSIYDTVSFAVDIAKELIGRFNQAMTSKEDEKAGYRADFTVIDELSDGGVK